MTTATEQYTPISYSVEAGKDAQTWSLEEYGHLPLNGIGPDKTRIVVKVDHSYPSQGGARLEILTPSGWQPIAQMFGGEAKAYAYTSLENKNRYSSPGTRAFFAPVIDELAARAHALLS